VEAKTHRLKDHCVNRHVSLIHPFHKVGNFFDAQTIQFSSGIETGITPVTVEIENRGVAPFYYDWKPEYGLILDGKAVTTFQSSGQIIGLLPGDKPRTWEDKLNLSGLNPGTYKLALRIPNSLKNGHPLKFANKTQDADAPGWVTLSSVEVK